MLELQGFIDGSGLDYVDVMLMNFQPELQAWFWPENLQSPDIEGHCTDVMIRGNQVGVHGTTVVQAVLTR